MKKFLLEFMILFVVLSVGGQVFAYSAVPASTGVSAAPRHFSNHAPTGVLNINSMSPATYRYPASYAHRTHVVPNNMVYSHNAGGMYPTHVNYVGGCCQPVYVMRGGMVKVNKNKNKRSGRIRSIYEEEYYEE